ncbi:uncharacterized protein LOC142323038 isoform X2 [Lycorma delicatula]|uniref:uncharacterized protein LOC142323038 isoform X2 n=1 Tax=Lycorma delicatula TaxID=130591 RepID=UPI003F514382
MAQIIGSSDNGFGDEESENDQFPNAKNLKKLGGFHTFGISLPLIKGIEKKGYKTPTPIQRKLLKIISFTHSMFPDVFAVEGHPACSSSLAFVFQFLNFGNIL